MQAQWAKDDKEKARKYRAASIFLAERVLDDVKHVKANLPKMSEGSYIQRQQAQADKSLNRRIQNLNSSIDFLKKANRDFFIGTEEQSNKEFLRMFKSFAEYFKGDVSNLKLAKISYDIDSFNHGNIDASKSVADAIVLSLEGSAPDIFSK
jgi:uncharacterized protein YaaQ